MKELVIIGGIVLGVLGLLPVIVSMFLRDVEAGTIRLVSWLQGSTITYRGPGKSKEIPLLTTATTISSKVLNVDLDITDQTSTLTDLLSSSGRRAINLLTHDQLFSAKTAPRTPRPALPVVTGGSTTDLQVAPDFGTEDDDDPLAIIIRKACSRELADLGLGFNSLNIKV